MKYLGISNVSGFFSAGVYDDALADFTQSAFIDVDRVMGTLYFTWYQKSPGKLLRFLICKYSNHVMRRLLSKIDYKGVDRVILPGYLHSSPLTQSIPLLQKKFADKVILTDHLWSFLNAAKLQPKFSYPALVMSSSVTSTMLAYLPDKETIEIIDERASSPSTPYKGLGFLSIDFWARELEESVYWSDQKTSGKRQVYELYKERGASGKSVVDLREDILHSEEPFAEDVLREKLPEKMKTLRNTYDSLEHYRNDWVASQQQAIQDIFSFIKQRESKKRKISSYIVTAGISRNPVFEHYQEWLRAPSSVAGAQSMGNALAFLGYCIEKEGLHLQHDRWSHR